MTQGRNGCCQQWVKDYKILYSSDCQNFQPLSDQGGQVRPDFFLLVDLRDFFSDLGSWGRIKINKKALKMTS